MAIHLMTGNGRGKTTSAIGTAIRMLGNNRKVLIVQFMKGRKNTGEYKFLKNLENCTIKQFGRKEFVNLKNPCKLDKELAQRGMKFIKNLALAWKNKKTGKEKTEKKDKKTKSRVKASEMPKAPDLIILDEINLACSIGILDTNEVLDLLKIMPKKTEIMLTGRRAPKALIKVSEFATEMKDIKHSCKTIKGIHF